VDEMSLLQRITERVGRDGAFGANLRAVED
jgi:hypothetical protein